MAEVQVLYAATANGLAQLASPGTSHRWRLVDQALAGQDVLSVRGSAVEPLHVFAGASSGLYASRDGGASWAIERPEVITALAATGDGAIYAGTQVGTILVGGSGDWTEGHVGPDAAEHLSLLIGGRLVAVYKNGSVEMLADGQWQPLNLIVPCASEVVCSVETPADLYITNETGLVTHTGTRSVPGKPTGALVLLAGKPEVLLFGTVDSLQRSEDGGATVQAVDGPTDVRVLVSPPRYQDYAYAGTGSGELWLSSNRGRSWRKLQDGLAPVRDLSFARVR